MAHLLVAEASGSLIVGGATVCTGGRLTRPDRGMEYQTRFKRHVRARLDFIASGEYAKTFGQEAVLVVYATTGQTPTYRQTRATAMCAWIMEVLHDLGAKHWARIFRVTSLVSEEIYTTPLFAAPVWYRPDSATPVPLLSPHHL